jgi:hypothetical protein
MSIIHHRQNPLESMIHYQCKHNRNQDGMGLWISIANVINQLFPYQTGLNQSHGKRARVSSLPEIVKPEDWEVQWVANLGSQKRNAGI